MPSFSQDTPETRQSSQFPAPIRKRPAVPALSSSQLPHANRPAIAAAYWQILDRGGHLGC